MTETKTSTRKVIVSPGYGAGIASWADTDEQGYNVVECPALIAYVEGGGRDGDEAQRICVEAGVLGPDEHFYWGGLRDARVIEVTPPYRIEEYDGYESVITQQQEQGWRH